MSSSNTSARISQLQVMISLSEQNRLSAKGRKEFDVVQYHENNIREYRHELSKLQNQ